ncbi:uncharacterized protein N0V89_003946 [Didymosphaeria variabile]|uniref:BHLH domain-containing protein n=1 Tax=Didymosphaeria variabile TaxID=1932322 RepID=A0A9W8XQA6_9PLEO|nr:uncharacterized protein N0V89_003946 [Didymosphaeria variabile]KAJ4355921.1 hypothetical protein N0V89_003946 [Didymosphaeria variabile]
MDYIDYSSFPTFASTDCSPSTDAFSHPTSFDKAFTPCPFTTSDTSLETFDAYAGIPLHSDGAIKSLDATSSVAPTEATQFKSVLDQPFGRPPFGQLDVFTSGFAFDTNPVSSAAFDLSLSPLSDDSQALSVCGDGPQDASLIASPSLSPQPYLKRESTDSSLKFEDCPDPSNPPKRKRGRPRLDRSTSSRSSSSAKTQRSKRLPHNQVERKYREGLNASLERLRKTVPTLCQEDDLGGLLGHPKPSKAMILEGAIEYIKEIEKERDMYRSEIERLRRGSQGWNPTGNTGFLADS